MSVDIRILLQEWLNQSEKDLIREYNDMGLRSSGNLEKSLQSKVTGTDTIAVGVMTGSSYIYQLEHGRRPGKQPPIQAILDWINDKGIVADGISERSLAFIIARKIGLEGIQVPNRYNNGGLITNTFTDERLKDLRTILTTVIAKDSINDIVKEIKKEIKK